MSPRSLVLLAWFVASAPLVAQTPAYWPQFGGPDRNHVSRETDLLKQWPKEGPPLVWKVTNLGGGLAPVSVAEGRIYTLAFRQDHEYAVALDRGTGKEIWSRVIGQAREGPSMRHLRQRQPVIDRDRLYVFSGDGELFCLDSDSGQTLWKKDYAKDFGGKASIYGWNENPLVDGDRLICSPGSSVVALDKKTGALLWKTGITGAERTSVAPVVPIEVGRIRQYVKTFPAGLHGVSAQDGKLLWSYNRTSGPACQPPLVRRDYLVTIGGIGQEGTLLNVVPGDDGFRVEEVYTSKDINQTVHGGAVVVGEHVYLASGAYSGGGGRLTCIEFKSGKFAWQQPPADRLNRVWCMLAAEDRLYCRLNGGEMILVETTPEGYRQRGRFLPAERSKETPWTVPVLAGGKLYLRDQDILLCYDVRANRPMPAAKDQDK